MKEELLLSIITVTFNNKNGLDKTLKSISEQNLGIFKIEHIIVDNLSNDGTYELIEKYRSEYKYKYNISYLREKDSGIYEAMNKGIKKSKGKYVLFMNSGDHFFNSQSSADLLLNSNDFDIVFGNLNIVKNGQCILYSPPDLLNFKYFLNNSLPHQASIIKKELFLKYGFYDEELKISSDHNFFLLAICKHKVSYFHLNKTISTYYFDGMSSDINNRKIIEREKNDFLNKEFSEYSFKIVKKNIKSEFETPVLLLIFNRPNLTKKVFNEISKIRPSKLFIVADAPRDNFQEDIKQCELTRSVVNNITWNCEVHRLYRNFNFGCGNGVSRAIDWFFSINDEGIILEDDILPSREFFYFCRNLLEKYRYDNRISHINGSSFIDKKSKDTYYYSRFFHVWGWATWKRSWKNYNFYLDNFNDFITSNLMDNLFLNKKIINFWKSKFEDIYFSRVDTWDYQWVYANFSNNFLSVMPFSNLVKNIGFGENATHTKNSNDYFANKEVESMNINKIVHPSFFYNDISFDNIIYERLNINKINEKSFFSLNYLKQEIYVSYRKILKIFFFVRKKFLPNNKYKKMIKKLFIK